jgi:LPS O-antigen subunit length determinant protein (WzzB/FepE family)
LDKELSLRDYGRVLWSGRRIIAICALVAALAGLVLSLTRTTTYSATSRVFLGQVTTPTGQPVLTPDTNPTTAPDTLGGDDVIAKVAAATGVEAKRIRDGISFTVPRSPGAQAGNQPAVATITFVDEDRREARDVVNAYADEVLKEAQAKVATVQTVLQDGIDDGEGRLRSIEQSVRSAEVGLRQAGSEEARATYRSLLFASQQRLYDVLKDISDLKVALAKSNQYEEPRLISRSDSSSSSATLVARLRTVILAFLIGLIVGIVIVFVWRGSPAGRAGEIAHES